MRCQISNGQECDDESKGTHRSGPAAWFIPEPDAPPLQYLRSALRRCVFLAMLLEGEAVGSLSAASTLPALSGWIAPQPSPCHAEPDEEPAARRDARRLVIPLDGRSLLRFCCSSCVRTRSASS